MKINLPVMDFCSFTRKLETETRVNLEAYQEALKRREWVSSLGRVTRVLGPLVEGNATNASVGELCELFHPSRPEIVVPCEVVGFTENSALLSPLKSLEGVSPSYVIRLLRKTHTVAVSSQLLGRILDGFGSPMDGKPPIDSDAPGVQVRSVIANAPLPGERPRIQEIFPTGVRSLDALLTMGKGQRIGIFAGPGCGKTSLMAAIARGSKMDVMVLALIGERGREVREFTEHEIEPELLKRCIIVCATSDRTSIERVRAAFTATAIAEGLREQGLNVLLMVDSLTRLARAQREIGLAAGEMPARAGFPPSVYALLPRLIERAGLTETGSITAVYTLLLEGDIKSDPISEEAVSLLDGHVLLAKRLAEQGHYPAIDVLPSISRIMSNIVDQAHMQSASRIRQILSGYREVELLVRLGEYRAGIDPETDEIVSMYPKIQKFLMQNTRTPLPWAQMAAELKTLTMVSRA